MRKVLIIIFILFFACNKHKSSNKTLISQENNAIVEKKKNNIISPEIISQIPDFDLPFGNINLIKTNFPNKFGVPIEIDENGKYLNIKPDGFTKIINSIRNTWNNISNTKGIKYKLRKEDSLEYSKYSNFGKKVIRSNYEFIGKKKKDSFKILIGKHLNDNPLISYDFINLLTVSSSGNVVDNLPIYIYENDYTSKNLTFSFIDKKMIIYSNNFFSIEREYFLNKSKKYQISSRGKFISYYVKNGQFKNENEQGLVKNNTREGNWIEKKKLSIPGYRPYFFIESNYKEEQAIGTWKYYNLEYDKDSNGESIFKTATKGVLLYTETYENGEMVKRDFIKND